MNYQLIPGQQSVLSPHQTIPQLSLIPSHPMAAFLASQHNSTESGPNQSSHEDNNEKSDIEPNTTNNTSPVPQLSSISSISIVKSLAKGFIPSRLPSGTPLDSLPPKSPPPRSPKSPKSPLSGGSHRSSTDSKDDSLGSNPLSPKLPPSPVLKALQATAVEYVVTPPSHTTPPNSGTGHSSHSSSRNESPQHQKQTVYRKVSNRMLESSSSEDEDDEPPMSPVPGKDELHKVHSTGSTPSPRTPNSYRILSSIAANQATAFRFPPNTSPLHSRPSSYERQSERQSSDEYSTPMSSFRSRSTSSEYCDDSSLATDPRLTPQPLPRSRRVSPLRKQRAIAEELHESQRSSLEAECGSCPSSATVSAPDSGVADCNYSSPPKNFFSGSTGPVRRSSSGGNDQQFGLEPAPAARELATSLSEGEAVVEKVTGYVFRKMTVKKRNSSPLQHSSGTPAQPDQNHRSMDGMPSGSGVGAHRVNTIAHDRPTGMCLPAIDTILSLSLSLIPLTAITRVTRCKDEK